MSGSLDMDFDVIDAALRGNLRELKNLLESGGDPNAELWFGYQYYTYSAMSEACGAKQHQAMDILLMHGASPESEFDYDARVIHGLAMMGDMEGMRVLLNYEPDVDAKGSVWMRSGKMPRYQTLTATETAKMLGHEDVAALLDRHKAIPRIEDLQTVTRDSLLACNINGDCALDRPDTWHRFGEVMDALTANGETLTKVDLLQQGGDGKPFLHKAVACNALPQVMDLLHAQGDGLHHQELLNGKGEPSELLDAISKKFALALVFTEDNWQGCKRAEMDRVYRALDSDAREDVPNYHALRMQLEQGREGYGRRMAGGVG